MFGLTIIDFISLAIILLISIWLHEYAHAYVSYRLWDPTPKLQWRLTSNPLKHMDPIGFFMIFLIWFGWWKPVQVNPMYYKNQIKGEFLVALAWPATNIVLATIWILVMLIISKVSGMWVNDIFLNSTSISLSFFVKFSMINIVLAVFNMIPLPPLDWFRIVKMISFKFASMIEKYTTYISIVFLILILWPGRASVGGFLSTVSEYIFKFIYTIFATIFY